MFCLAMTSALPQINAAQALVDVSWATAEARIYTDSVQAFEVKVRADTDHRQAAIDFVDGHEAKVSLSREQSIEPDLQEHVVVHMSTFEKALRAKVAEKSHSLEPDELERRIQKVVAAYQQDRREHAPAHEWNPGIHTPMMPEQGRGMEM